MIWYMELPGTYRHELKYPINTADYYALRQRLSSFMKRDPHTGKDGVYTVRSIYFDNADDKALREKVYGVQKREKFRIRYYNDDFSFITLEKKMKYNDLCLKLDALLREEECFALLSGESEWMRSHPSELVRELYCKLKYQQLRPRVMVSYLREPYVYPPGNVRVTFDSKIRTTLFRRNFLLDEMRDICATDSSGDVILEVKYDAFLPEIISCLLQAEGLRRQAFSKYRVCRRFG